MQVVRVTLQCRGKTGQWVEGDEGRLLDRRSDTVANELNRTRSMRLQRCGRQTNTRSLQVRERGMVNKPRSRSGNRPPPA